MWLIAITILYLGVFLYWIFALNHKESKSSITKNERSFSIVVAFRNEAKNLPKLLVSLAQLKYNNFEVIFVNDHSTDDGESLIHSTQYSLFSLDSDKIGKKEALTLGISKANGDMIFTTDADCILSPELLSILNAQIENGKHHVILGPVYLQHQKQVFDLFQFVDFTMMQMATVASVFANKIFLANGANFCFPKRLFDEVGGYHDINSQPSGDDILLLYKFENAAKIKFAFHSDAMVYTHTEKTFKQFLMQRLRWASKSNQYPKGFGLYVSWLFGLLNFLFFIFLFLAPFNIVKTKLLVVGLGIKFIAELMLLWQGKKIFNLSSHHFILLLILQPIHIIYVTLIGIVSQLYTYEWKNRRHIKN